MSRRYLRPGVFVGHVLVLAAALTCLRLGWWQWHVFEAAGGTAQNLGYALLWPVFAGSFIYMWLRFLHLEATHGSEAIVEAPTDDDTSGAAASGSLVVDAPDGVPDAVTPESRHGRPGRTSREIFTVGVGYIDTDDDDPELAAYNRALAELAEQDERRAR